MLLFPSPLYNVKVKAEVSRALLGLEYTCSIGADCTMAEELREEYLD